VRQLDVIPAQPTAPEYHLDVTRKDWLFSTLQGEGIHAGVPSLFLRLFGCNLTCAKCDTKYSWQFPEKNSFHVHVDTVAAHIRASMPELFPGRRHLVITGGEPMLQTEGVGDLLQELEGRYKVTMETNGTIYQEYIARNVELASLSPKHDHIREMLEDAGKNEKVIPFYLWLRNTERAQVKVVMESPEDITQTLNFFEMLRDQHDMPPERLIGQLEFYNNGFDMNQYIERFYAAGFRLGIQQHKVWKLR